MPASSARPARHTELPAILFSAGIAAGPGISGALAQRETREGVLDPLTLPLFDATPAARIADIVDCINSGDPALQYAIFTQCYLAGQVADPSVTNQPAFEQHLSRGPSTSRNRSN